MTVGQTLSSNFAGDVLPPRVGIWVNVDAQGHSQIVGRLLDELSLRWSCCDG